MSRGAQQQLQLSRKPGLVTLENSRRTLRDSSHPIPQDMRRCRCGQRVLCIVELSFKLNTCRYFIEFIQTSGTGTWSSLMWNDYISKGVNFYSKDYSSFQIRPIYGVNKKIFTPLSFQISSNHPKWPVHLLCKTSQAFAKRQSLKTGSPGGRRWHFVNNSKQF